jgi:hypothetical protein
MGSEDVYVAFKSLIAQIDKWVLGPGPAHSSLLCGFSMRGSSSSRALFNRSCDKLKVEEPIRLSICGALRPLLRVSDLPMGAGGGRRHALAACGGLLGRPGHLGKGRSVAQAKGLHHVRPGGGMNAVCVAHDRAMRQHAGHAWAAEGEGAVSAMLPVAPVPQ